MEPILIRRACALVALLALAGCQRMVAESVVNADGGGSRTLTLTLDEDASTTDPGLYMGVTAARGWTSSVTEETGDDGKRHRLPTHRHEARVNRLADWADVSGDLRVLGAAPGKPHAEVDLDNRVSVERGQGTFTYRETFTWNGALEVLVGFVADRFRDETAAAYPRLGPAELAELRGLALGICTMGARAAAGAEGGLELDEDLAIATLADLGHAIVGGDRAHLRDIAAAAINDQPGAIEDFVNRELPGYALAGTTTLELRVVLPGRVVETNGQLGDDGVVTWSFQLGDPLVGPRECWARSEVGK
jgi:hypothetical protein